MDKKNLKEKILEASRHILAVEGYSGLSMRKIARKVDCQAASIYHHFESKDKIVHSLINEGYQLQLEEINRATEGILDPIQRIETRARAYVDFGLHHPEYYRIMYMLVTKGMERYPKENYRRNSQNMAALIEDLKMAKQQGRLQSEEDPEILANASTAMLHGIISLLLSNRLHIKLDKEKIKEVIIMEAVRFCGS